MGEREWLDGEVERMLQQKQAMQALEKVPIAHIETHTMSCIHIILYIRCTPTVF